MIRIEQRLRIIERYCELDSTEETSASVVFTFNYKLESIFNLLPDRFFQFDRDT